MAEVKTNETTVRTDILPEALKEVQPHVKVYAEQQFNFIVRNTEGFGSKEVTPHPAKNIIEVMDLIKNAFEDYDKRTHVSEDAKVVISYEDPDRQAAFETVTIKDRKSVV